MRRKRAVALPSAGQAFAIPLEDGRFGVCRVLRQTAPEETARQGVPYVLAAASSWIGDTLPDADDPRLREILRLTHHSHQDALEMIWISDPVPESFILLGTIEPSETDRQIACGSYSSWGSFGLQLLMQWEWDHERDAVIEADRKQAAASEAAREAGTAQYAAHMDSLTLEDLRKRTWFEDWKGFVKPSLIKACRKIVEDTIRRLIDLGDDKPLRAVVRSLRQCILDLNALDDKHKHFIETTLREDLSEAFDEIAYAAGIKGHEGLADRWRDW